MDPRIFTQLLFDQCNIDPSKPVLAGISGGPDSVCLLHLLYQSGIQTIAAHLDHSLRPTSKAEADFVAALCANSDLPLIRKQVDAAAYANQHRLSVEEGARMLRYEFLFEAARTSGAQAVLVAHHADDQAETVLMHILRGSGSNGLAGMRIVTLPNPWSDKIALVRPLLLTWRDEIEAYCRDNQLESVQDESNLDTRYYRNRIRHELIPSLKSYNPMIKDRLQRMSEVIGQEDDLLRILTENAWNEVFIQGTSRYIRFQRYGMRAQHPALARRLIRKAILILNQSLRDIEFDCVERGVEFIQESNHSNQEVLCAGLSIFNFFRDQLVIAFDNDPLHDLWPQMQAGLELELPEIGALQINDNWEIQASPSQDWVIGNDPNSCLINLDRLDKSLVVGTAGVGDRFTPFGMGGKTKKMGDFWTDAGLPIRARRRWPLVRSEDQIIWVPGFRISESVRVTEQSKNILRLTLVKK